MNRKVLSLLLALFCCLHGASFAATVIMKDGSREYGFLIEERSDAYVIRRGGEDIEIPRDEVAKIETAPTAEQTQLYTEVMSFYSTQSSSGQIFKPVTPNKEQQYKPIKEETLYGSNDRDGAYEGIDGGMYHGLSEIEETAKKAEDELKRMQDDFDVQHHIDQVDSMIDENNQSIADLEHQNKMLDVLEAVGYEVNDLRNAINSISSPFEDPFNN